MKLRKLKLVVAVAVLSLSSIAANAAPITLAQLNAALPGLEAGMEAIFAVTNITDIVIQPVIVVADNATGYLNIDSNAKQTDLIFGDPFGVRAGFPIVTSYITEQMSFCGGGPVPGLIGCAARPGNAMTLEGNFLIGASGAGLWAHELGHNLSLPHINDTSNLMNPFICATCTGLTAAQIAAVNASALVVNGVVTIRAVLIQAAGVPVSEPGTLALLLFGFLLLVIGRRRQTA